MNITIKPIHWVLTLVLTAGLLSGCYYDKSERNIEFAPNMYNSLPLEPYSQTDYWDTDIGGNYPGAGQGVEIKFFDDGLAAQKAPEGTVPREDSWYRTEAYSPYAYSNSTAGYDSATQFLRSPLNDPETNENGYTCTEATFKQGKVVYDIYCINCHGPNGKGQGNLVTAGVYAGVPAYSDRAYLTEGQMFHTVTHGKGIMGSHASQLTPQERWAVVCYIQEWVEEGQVAEEAQ